MSPGVTIQRDDFHADRRLARATERVPFTGLDVTALLWLAHSGRTLRILGA